MVLDHYVSQVHLRNFYSPALGDQMYAVRKSDWKTLTSNSESVCRIDAGSTNAYLTEDRLIEDASLLAKAGVPLQAVASALGHADARMTEKHYAHLPRTTHTHSGSIFPAASL
jgi:hypothetical protein